MTPDLIARLRAYGRTDAGPKGEVLLNQAADQLEALRGHAEAMAKALKAWDKWEGELLLDPRPWGCANGFQVTDDRYDQYVELQVDRAQALAAYRSAFPEVE